MDTTSKTSSIKKHFGLIQKIDT